MSPKMSRAARVCPTCGKDFFPRPAAVRAGKGKYCGRACYHPAGRKPRPLAERFWEQIRRGAGCWPWAGTRTRTGYGVIGAGGKKNRGVHRVSWELHFGPIPPGTHVLHRCDNPSCCNPAHLFLGTHADNMKDMAAKGRAVSRQGEQNGNARLTAGVVAAIRARHALGGMTLRALAREFGIARSTVRQIVHRITWVE